MARKPETVFREKFSKRLDEIASLWHESIQQVAIRGTPDKLLCINGYFAGVELKATDEEEPSPLQKHKLQSIIRAGGMAFVAHPGNEEAVLSAIRKVAQGAHPDSTRRDQWGK